jgi:alpha-glucoside transport system permease protein
VTSILITVPATVIQLTVATMGAYAFAWMNFPGKNIYFIIIVGLMVVPIQMTLVPLLSLFKLIGLQGTIVSVWLAHTGFGLPFEVFLLRNYLGGLPREIFESAEVDGAGHEVRFLRIAVPMTLPAIASLTIFVVLGVWNDLLVGLTFLGTSVYRPFTVVIAQLTTSFGGGWQFLTAAAVLQMALPLAVFIFLQRYFVRGVTAGSVKG